MWRPDQIEEWEAQFPETHVQNLPDDIAFLIDQHKAGIDPVIRASLTGKQQAEMILPIRLLRWLEFVETFHHTYKRVSQKKPPKAKSS